MIDLYSTSFADGFLRAVLACLVIQCLFFGFVELRDRRRM